jgi:hypothetical protein
MHPARVKVFLPKGSLEQRMPLKQYFTFVGGVLLLLLFIFDAYLPKLPVLHRAPDNLPVIRIHSDRKWPERIVYDTSHPTIVPASMASSVVITPAPEMITETSVGPRKWEAFAMLPLSGAQLQASSTKMQRPRSRHQGKIIRGRATIPRVAMASRLQFSQSHQIGWSGRSFW